MSGVNKVILVGRLGKDPEIRYTADQKPIANITLATSESWKDKNTGQKQEKTEWHRVVFFGGVAGVVADYLKKGAQIYIEGKMQTRKWQDNTGQDRYTTEVVVDGYNGVMQMLGGESKPNQETAGPHGERKYQQMGKPQQAYQPAKQSRPAPPPNQPQGAFQQTSGGNADGLDDDIPFLEHERFML